MPLFLRVRTWAVPDVDDDDADDATEGAEVDVGEVALGGASSVSVSLDAVRVEVGVDVLRERARWRVEEG
eukprot:5722-Eustigmatos_ZCMA.PRE.1